MELLHRDDRRDDYAFISGSTPQPWYSRYKQKIFGIGIAVLVVVVIVVLVASARSVKASSSELKELFSISWNGSCPWEPDECPQSFESRPPLLLVSLDGFRGDYLKRGFNPVLQKIAQCGIEADFMYSVFPTKTFPNHFSQVTGLYPSSHGIIDNSMKDSERVFYPGNSQDPFWWEGEPIWVTAQKQGLKSATFFWPGSDVEINGTFPTYYRKFNSDTPFEERVDQVLEWLDLPEVSRPNFLTLYLNQPDTAAHKYGTDSKEVDAALVRVDSMIERLYSGLQQRNLSGCVNIFFLSDHGMTNIDCSRVINLEKYTNVTNVDSFVGSFGRLRQNDSDNSTELSLISDLQCKNKHMRVYKKEQMPIRMHYSNHRRIEPIILEIDNGWTLFKQDVNSVDNSKCTGGAHGYDNMFPDMRATFAAIGPSIKRNITVKPFLNIELYELMCELINITANPNNGTRGSMHHLLREPKFLESQLEPEPPVTAEVPKNEIEYEVRVNTTICFCKQMNKQMAVDPSMKQEQHLPFGIPHSTEDIDTLRLLYNNDYVSAFDTKLLMPMWSSFTLNNVALTKEDVCWIGDARLGPNETVRCTDYNATTLTDDTILQRPLYPIGLSNPSSREEAEYITNSIPMSEDYANALESEVIRLLVEWSEREDLNVVMGPAFDLLGSGIRPSDQEFRKEQKYGRLIVPTHLFVIATKCSQKVNQLKDCDSSQLESLSMLLPNHPYPQNCEEPKSVIAKNPARVRDIENLTGLSFFTGLPIYDAIRLRTRMPQLNM